MNANRKAPMTQIIQLVTAVALLLAFSWQTPAAAGMKGGKKMTENIHWLGHDTFKIVGDRVVYTDPFQLKANEIADIILITHEHHDHCSPEDVQKILGPDTVIFAPADCAGRQSPAPDNSGPGGWSGPPGSRARR